MEKDSKLSYLSLAHHMQLLERLWGSLKALQSIQVEGMELDKRRANNVWVCSLPAGSPFFCLNCVQPLTFSSGFLLKEDQWGKGGQSDRREEKMKGRKEWRMASVGVRLKQWLQTEWCELEQIAKRSQECSVSKLYITWIESMNKGS